MAEAVAVHSAATVDAVVKDVAVEDVAGGRPYAEWCRSTRGCKEHSCRQCCRGCGSKRLGSRREGCRRTCPAEVVVILGRAMEVVVVHDAGIQDVVVGTAVVNGAVVEGVFVDGAVVQDGVVVQDVVVEEAARRVDTKDVVAEVGVEDMVVAVAVVKNATA